MPESYHCSSCGADIALADVNVANDIALCRQCGKTMAFSLIAPIAGAAEVDLQHPPEGVRIEDSPLGGRSIIYRKVSPIVLFLIPFTAVWSGGSMSAIYGSQIKKGHFELMPSLFGMPFLLGSVVLVSVILFLVCGRWRIRYNQGLLEVAIEIGPLGWTRRLACECGARVSLQASTWQNNGTPQQVIQVDCQSNTLKFGTMLPPQVKAFIAEALRRTLATVGEERGSRF